MSYTSQHLFNRYLPLCLSSEQRFKDANYIVNQAIHSQTISYVEATIFRLPIRKVLPSMLRINEQLPTRTTFPYTENPQTNTQYKSIHRILESYTPMRAREIVIFHGQPKHRHILLRKALTMQNPSSHNLHTTLHATSHQKTKVRHTEITIS